MLSELSARGLDFSSCRLLEKHEQEREGFQCKEKEYLEELEAMGKQHATELDAKTSLIISLRDRIRFLEGKPMSTGAEMQFTAGKEIVNFETRVLEPLEFSPAQFTPTPDKMPLQAKPTRRSRRSRIERKPGPKRRQKTGGWRKFRTRHSRRAEGLRRRQGPGKRARKTTTVPDSNVPPERQPALEERPWEVETQR